jgi:ribonuclease VapC
MFVDASALTAMIVDEHDGIALMRRMEKAGRRMTSPIVVWEATLAVARLTGKSFAETKQGLDRFLDLGGVELTPIPADVTALAIDAYDRFGKGRHRARLNMGDCFAYACARHFGQPLLYKGDDFAQTDIEAA